MEETKYFLYEAVVTADGPVLDESGKQTYKLIAKFVSLSDAEMFAEAVYPDKAMYYID